MLCFVEGKADTYAKVLEKFQLNMEALMNMLDALRTQLTTLIFKYLHKSLFSAVSIPFQQLGNGAYLPLILKPPSGFKLSPPFRNGVMHLHYSEREEK